MATAYSNTNSYDDFTSESSIFDLSIPALLKLPVNTSLDLFQILDICRCYGDALIENDFEEQRMALCGRLFAGLEVLKVVLTYPLPDYLIEQLTVDEVQSGGYISPLTNDSETLCGYCSALALVLLSQRQPLEQAEQITELLFDMLYVLTEDLKAPRFIRTSEGLAMIEGETLLPVH